ncbi:hypothetical protein KP509_19G027400 [Ceratopteris richardii]|uniref:Secreted protein n=1 Tax=Ceratopteris richardii TaxID=49495 RepID=A0A8T2SKT4_CERRI|nr:hypothetical protein KP509_19G027400 [Ceratopteris richardii]
MDFASTLLAAVIHSFSLVQTLKCRYTDGFSTKSRQHEYTCYCSAVLAENCSTFMPYRNKREHILGR